MCGIAGKLVFDPATRVEVAHIQAMLRPILHRGPDGEGIHVDGNVGLGHCRLSIIDLDSGGQPMTNEDETVWIIFNGEIYNFEELREQLLAKGHVFRSRSDTEVILHLYEDRGPECVRELRGMFAFAIWDSRCRRLFLARDRVGIKPLYYCRTPGALHFASEVKAIIADPQIEREINLKAVRTFLSFDYVPGEETLLKGICKLLPGHYLTADARGIEIRQYWDLRYTRERWNIAFEDAVAELHDLLQGTVRDHMIADVPVGILASGGVDSSAILSFAARSSPKKLQTFTMGFDGGEVVDERPFARLIAQKFGTEHHEISISEADFWSFLPAYIWHMEEPVCEPPAVALFYVSELARNHVKVLLSGEGGDEAFAGYGNYSNMMRLERIGARMGRFSKPAGAAARFAGWLIGDERVQRYGEALGRPLSSQYFSRSSGPTAFFNRRAGSLLTPDFLGKTTSESAAVFIAGLTEVVKDEPLLNQMLYVDTKTWLPDDLLVKADKMTMANSIELRVPLLDHTVLEFAASLPPEFKVNGRNSKRVLKAAFAKTLPEEVLHRKKAGFPVPYESWLRTGLKQQVEEVLLCDRAISRGYFQPRELRRILRDNLATSRHAKEIFSLVVLELWHRTFLDVTPAAPAENKPNEKVLQAVAT